MEKNKSLKIVTVSKTIGMQEKKLSVVDSILPKNSCEHFKMTIILLRFHCEHQTMACSSRKISVDTKNAISSFLSYR